MSGRVIALLLPAVLAACAGGALDSRSLGTEAESIQSFAAEGALLAADVADGRSSSGTGPSSAPSSGPDH